LQTEAVLNARKRRQAAALQNHTRRGLWELLQDLPDLRDFVDC
jgi:hypothetical protein